MWTVCQTSTTPESNSIKKIPASKQPLLSFISHQTSARHQMYYRVCWAAHPTAEESLIRNAFWTKIIRLVSFFYFQPNPWLIKYKLKRTCICVIVYWCIEIYICIKRAPFTLQYTHFNILFFSAIVYLCLCNCVLWDRSHIVLQHTHFNVIWI